MVKKPRKPDKALGRDPLADLEELAEHPAPETAAEVGLAAPTPAEPLAEWLVEAEAGSPAEAAPEPALAEAPADPQSAILDELIAAVDEEMAQAFGPGVMAGPAPAAPTATDLAEEQHVLFALAGAEYAAPLAYVIEIGRPPDATPVPHVPDWVLGVANLRGDVISLVDLRRFLGLEPAERQPASRILVAQARSEDLTTALVVDRVTGIRSLPLDQISAPAAPIADRVAPYLRGVYERENRLLVVLDLERLLLSPEMRQFET